MCFFNYLSFIPIRPQHPKYADFKKSLKEAEKLYKNSSANSKAAKEALMLHLNSAYRSLLEIKGKCRKIPKTLEIEAARIFFLYGQCLHGPEMKQKIRQQFFQDLVKKGSLHEIERILPSYPSYLNRQDSEGKTLLIHAIESHRPDHEPTCDRHTIINSLLNMQANVNLADNNGWTPLYHASTQYRTDILSSLIQKQADPNLANSDFSLPLHRLCDRGSLDGVNFLIDSNANVNAINCVGTPLFYAASKGHLSLVKTLCEKGKEADLNLFGDPLEGTPLKVALLNNRHEVIEYLKARGATLGAELNFIPIQGQNVDKFGRNAVFYEAAAGSISALQKAENIAERDSKGRTALDYAVREGKREAVNYLLNRGADPMSRDNQGYFPLFWACQYHQADIAHDLIEYAKKAGILKDMLVMKDNFGWSLLRKAAERGNLTIVQLINQAMTAANVLTHEEIQEAIIKARDHNYIDIFNYLTCLQSSN